MYRSYCWQYEWKQKPLVVRDCGHLLTRAGRLWPLFDPHPRRPWAPRPKVDRLLVSNDSSSRPWNCGRQRFHPTYIHTYIHFSIYILLTYVYTYISVGTYILPKYIYIRTYIYIQSYIHTVAYIHIYIRASSFIWWITCCTNVIMHVCMYVWGNLCR